MSNVKFQESILVGINEIFQENTVISISGKAGTGKSSLALFLVGSYLTSSTPYSDSCVWIQASESFPKGRLETMFSHTNKQLAYLKENIFIAPSERSYTTYEQQLTHLGKLSNTNNLFPPDVRFIVIDNISHHLRFKYSQVSEIEKKAYLVNNFYDTLLSPLIFRCQREKINLILIHEVSFNVKSQQSQPFFHRLYERIKGVQITLLKSFITDQRTMELTVRDSKLSFKFDLIDSGFIFSQ